MLAEKSRFISAALDRFAGAFPIFAESDVAALAGLAALYTVIYLLLMFTAAQTMPEGRSVLYRTAADDLPS